MMTMTTAHQQEAFPLAGQPFEQHSFAVPQDDQQESFLCSLLSVSQNASPTGSNGSHITSPPPIVSDSAHSTSSGSSNSGGSPLSSASFQGFQDFMYGSTSFNGGMETMKDIKGIHPDVPGMPEQPMSASTMPMMPPSIEGIDQRALEFFFHSMNGMSGGQAMPAFNQMHQQSQAPQMGQSYGANPFPSDAGQGPNTSMPQAAFDFRMPTGLSMPQMNSQMQQLQSQQQHQVPQQHAGNGYPMLSRATVQPEPLSQTQAHLDSRKRSAPYSSPSYSQETMPSMAAPNSKRSRSSMENLPYPQPGPAVFSSPMGPAIPHMEVGSNATALAAIERLKATKRAAAAQLQSQREQKQDAGMVKTEPGAGPSAPRQEKKVAHNAIERRYRNNINARIAALRNAVPALRELRPKKPTRKGKDAIPEDLVDGVPAATKLNKATILGKATDYIRYLKSRELRLASEVTGLRELIRSLEGGEELLDLWQDEMERVVAAQQQEQQNLEDDSGDFDDDDGDDDDEETNDVRSSPSSSSRYMMGVAMGFTVLGSTSSEPHFAAHASGSHPAGRVIGASRQLLKRGMTATNIKVGSVSSLPHHLDRAKSHHLFFELIRGAAILACILFVFWPIIAAILPRRWTGKKRSKARDTAHLDSAKLASLKRTSAGAAEEDIALREMLGAPRNLVSSIFGLASIGFGEIAYRVALLSRPHLGSSETAAYIQLLDLETSMGPLAQRSLLARLHTMATVATLRNIGQIPHMSAPYSADLLSTPRIYGTMAIAIMRASSGSIFASPFAERFWTMAKRSILLASEGDENQDRLLLGARAGQDAPTSNRWLDTVLQLSLSEAFSLCQSPTSVASRYALPCDFALRSQISSALASISVIQCAQEIAEIWSALLADVATSTVYDEHMPALDAFAKHVETKKMHLQSVSNSVDREMLSQRIARLAVAVPRCSDLQLMANVTFGAWALLNGHVAVARSIALALSANAEKEQYQPMCAAAFTRLTLGADTAVYGTRTDDSLIEIDALASSTLSWLSFVRHFSSSSAKAIADGSLQIRRRLAIARHARGAHSVIDETQPPLSALLPRGSIASTETSSTLSTGDDDDVFMTNPALRSLDDSIDALTDVLTALGRRAALCDGKATATSLLTAQRDEADSGIEF